MIPIQYEPNGFMNIHVSYENPDSGRENIMPVGARTVSTVGHVKLLFSQLYSRFHAEHKPKAKQYMQIHLDDATEPLNDWDIFSEVCTGSKVIKVTFVPNCIQVCVYAKQKPVFSVNVPVGSEDTRLKDVLGVAEEGWIHDFKTLFKKGAAWYDGTGADLTLGEYATQKLCDVNHCAAFHVFEDFYTPLGIKETALQEACADGNAAKVDSLIKDYYRWLDYAPKFCGKLSDRYNVYGRPSFRFGEKDTYSSLLECIRACCLSDNSTENKIIIANKLFALRMDDTVAKQLFPAIWPEDDDDEVSDFESFSATVNEKVPEWYEKMYTDRSTMSVTIVDVYNKAFEEKGPLDMFLYLLDKSEPFLKFNGRSQGYLHLQNFLAPFFEPERPSPWKLAWISKNWELAHAIKKAFRILNEHATWKMFSMYRYKGSQEWYEEGLVNMGSKRRRIEEGATTDTTFVDLTLFSALQLQ